MSVPIQTNNKESVMKLKQYLQENTVTGFEILENQLIISVITDGDTGCRHKLNRRRNTIDHSERIHVR